MLPLNSRCETLSMGKHFCVICLIIAAQYQLPHACAEELAGRVVGVADGDTITMLDQERHEHKIRLAGIDAPEKHQAFGQRSKQALSDAVFNRMVTVDWSKRDKYGRLVGKIFLPGGVDANLRQIELGLAWHYRAYEREQLLADRQVRAGRTAGTASRSRPLGGSTADTALGIST